MLSVKSSSLPVNGRRWPVRVRGHCRTQPWASSGWVTGPGSLQFGIRYVMALMT